MTFALAPIHALAVETRNSRERSSVLRLEAAHGGLIPAVALYFLLYLALL